MVVSPTQKTAAKITWLSNDPVWVDQWPLTGEKLQVAQLLVQEQLEAGHIEPTYSPWNTPIFVIKKKSGGWRLLQDLRAINKTMEVMGPLQSGLPSPTAIPLNYELLILDLKDCFFTIPLHPDDCKRFAFSVPAKNFKEPAKRYCWKVLPQGMANSPTLCQDFVDAAIRPIRQQHPQAYIIHYMDDILLAHENVDTLHKAFADLQHSLLTMGLCIAPDKVQKSSPFQYLGSLIEGRTVRPQCLQIRTDSLVTLNDFQKLLGNINWVRPSLKLTTADLAPLYGILRGDSSPSSPRQLTAEAGIALAKVEAALQAAQLARVDLTKPLQVLIFPTTHTPTGVIWQDPGVIEWLHLAHSPTKVLTPFHDLVSQLIAKARYRLVQLVGQEPSLITVPFTIAQQNWLWQYSINWQTALANYPGQIGNHYPANKILQFLSVTTFIFPKIVKQQPLPQALTVFTDGSSSGKAGFHSVKCSKVIQTNYSSVQRVEIQALIYALENFASEPVNIYSDSAYVVGMATIIETATIGHTNSEELFHLFITLQRVIQKRQFPCFIGHIRSHSGLPGPLAAGNEEVDRLVASVEETTPFFMAQASHALHHQNASALRKEFHISREQARQIVKQCPQCVIHLPVPALGVNPRGLKPNQIWQMDVTHVPEFGRFRWVHVTIDTCSRFIFATPRTGESAKQVINHCLAAFPVMGRPLEIKTDNGPAYTSSSFQQFCKQYQIMHKKGIPYNPQGQAIVERANRTLKTQLQKQKGGERYNPTPQNQLNHALYTLNFLNCDDEGHTAAERHQTPGAVASAGMARWKDLQTGQWRGPDPVMMWGRGHICIFPEGASNPIWVPERAVRHHHGPGPYTSGNDASPATSPKEGEKSKAAG